MALLEVAGVAKRFGQLQALAGVDLTRGAGPDPRAHRAQRLRQEHADEVHRRRARPRRRHDPLRRPRHHHAPPLRSAPGAGLSIKFQITSVLPALSVYDNILLALQARSSLGSLIRSATRRALHERVLAALDHVALLDRADDLAGVLSHGEQQWLEIAMALAPQSDARAPRRADGAG